MIKVVKMVYLTPVILALGWERKTALGQVDKSKVQDQPDYIVKPVSN